MTKILMPSGGPEDWKQLLAQPSLNWATGYSARTLAHCWEAAADTPPGVESLSRRPSDRRNSCSPFLSTRQPLPGGQRESESDLFVHRHPDGLGCLYHRRRG